MKDPPSSGWRRAGIPLQRLCLDFLEHSLDSFHGFGDAVQFLDQDILTALLIVMRPILNLALQMTGFGHNLGNPVLHRFSGAITQVHRLIADFGAHFFAGPTRNR